MRDRERSTLEAGRTSGSVETMDVAPTAAAGFDKRQQPGDLVKDPICGIIVNRSTALKIERGNRTYYFCSANCLRTFESPEAELKAMRTRVTIALAGVLALAILRAAAFSALAAGATIITWAPIPALPWSAWALLGLMMTGLVLELVAFGTLAFVAAQAHSTWIRATAPLRRC